MLTSLWDFGRLVTVARGALVFLNKASELKRTVRRTEAYHDEKSLLLRLVSIIKFRDPDMLCSWDTQGGGIGYVIKRCKVHDVDFVTGVSRKIWEEGKGAVREKVLLRGDGLGKDWNDSTGAGHEACSVKGRVVVQVWRAVKEVRSKCLRFEF